MRSKKHSRIIPLIAILFSALALSGCWEGFDVVLHEPGVYKGPADPLTEQGTQAALAERLTLVQTDR